MDTQGLEVWDVGFRLQGVLGCRVQITGVLGCRVQITGVLGWRVQITGSFGGVGSSLMLICGFRAALKDFVYGFRMFGCGMLRGFRVCIPRSFLWGSKYTNGTYCGVRSL